ncbi:MAG TPA: hypothetical protein VGL94_09700 [Ktedonobacteraceae bacterium]
MDSRGRQPNRGFQSSKSFDMIKRNASAPAAMERSKTPDLSESPSIDAIEANIEKLHDIKYGIIKDIEMRQTQLSQQMLDISKKYYRVRAKHDSEKKKLQELEGKYERQENDQALADTTHSDAEREYSNFADQIAQVRARQDKLEADLRTQEANAEKISDEIKDLNTALRGGERILEDLQENKGNLDADLKVEDHKLENLQREQKALDTDLKAEEDNLKILRQNKSKLDSNKSKLAEDLEKLEINQQSLTNEIEAKKSELEFLQKNEEYKDTQLSIERAKLRGFNDSKKDYDFDMGIIERSDEQHIMKIKGEVEYDSSIKKIDIMTVFEVESHETAFDLKDLLIREDENHRYRGDIEESICDSMEYLKDALSFIEKYRLGAEFNHKVEEKKSESVKTPKAQITDDTGYDDACGTRDSLIDESNLNKEKYEKLHRIVKGDTDRKRLGKARDFINLSLDKFVMENKIVKLSQSIIEYNKQKISEKRGQLPLEENFDVTQEINTMFEREIVQHLDLQGKREQLLESVKAYLKDTNGKIEEAEQKISSLEGEREKILLFKKNIMNFEIEIEAIDIKITKTINIKTRAEGASEKAHMNYITQEKLVTGLKDRIRSNDASKEIDGQQGKIAELRGEIEDIDTREKKAERTTSAIKQDISKKNNEIEQAKNSIPSIKRKIAENLETIEDLSKKQQDAKDKQERASKDREHYAQLAQEIKDCEQRIQELNKQIKEHSRSFNQLVAEEEKLQREKIETLTKGIVDDYRTPRAQATEVIGP